MGIEPDLLELTEREPETTVRVMLCCKTSADISDAELERHGFHPYSRSVLEDECFIEGDIKLADLKALSSIPGIEEIASAPEAEAF